MKISQKGENQIRFDSHVTELFLNGGVVVETIREMNTNSMLVKMPLGSFVEFTQKEHEYLVIQDYIIENEMNIAHYFNGTIDEAKNELKRVHNFSQKALYGEV